MIPANLKVTPLESRSQVLRSGEQTLTARSGIAILSHSRIILHLPPRVAILLLVKHTCPALCEEKTQV